MGGPGSGPREGQGKGSTKAGKGKAGFSKKEETKLKKFQKMLRKQGKESAPFKIRNNLSKLMSAGKFRRIE